MHVIAICSYDVNIAILIIQNGAGNADARQKNVACVQTPPSPFWGEEVSVYRLQKNTCWKEDTYWVPRDYVLRYPNVERNNLIPTT